MTYVANTVKFNSYKEEQQAFYALLFQDSRNGQIFTLQKNNGKMKQQNTFRPDELLMDDKTDCYVSLNTFKSGKRITSQLFNRSAMFVDLDYHVETTKEKLEQIKENTLVLLEEAFKTGVLPVPTIITDSGRGFGLFYVLKRSIANVTAAQKSHALFEIVYKGLIKKVEEVLIDSEMEVDSKVTDVTRVARVPGTKNGKSGTMCHIIRTGTHYDLGELKCFCDLVSIKPDKPRKPARVVKFDSHLKGFLKVRLDRLKKIQDLRGDKCVDSCRELLAFIAYSALTQLYSKQTAVEELKAFNSRFTKPLPFTELKQLIKTTDQHVVEEGPYAGSKGFYPYADKTIIKALALTDEEVKIIGFGSGWKRDALAQEKRENKKKRNEYILEALANPELTYKEIANKFNVSVKTVQRLAAKHDIKRYCKKNKNAENKTLNFFENKKDIFDIESWCGGIWGDLDPSELPSLLTDPLCMLYRKMLYLSDISLAFNFITLCKTSDIITEGFSLLQKLSLLLTNYTYKHNLYYCEGDHYRIRKPDVYLADFDVRVRALVALLDGKDIYIQGVGGTGKSTFASSYIDMLETKKIKFVAPTGVAAENINGETIHKFFHLDLNLQSNSDSVKNLKDIDVLVVDELSMVDLHMYDKMIDLLNECEKECGKRPQLILCGDFKQQGPVVGDYAFKSQKNAVIRDNVFIFTSNVRQRNDIAFGKALQCISDGDRKGVDYINEHALIGVKDLDQSLEDGVLYLCGYKTDVERINNMMIAKHKQDNSYHEFKDSRGVIVPAYVGMPIMFTVNRKRFKNGTRGIIKKVTNKFVLVDIAGLTIKISSDMLFDDQGGYLAMPFEPCYAMTVHKAQGLTLDKIILDPVCFAEGQLYTALSRVRSLKDIMLVRKISYTDVKVSDIVLDYFNCISCA